MLVEGIEVEEVSSHTEMSVNGESKPVMQLKVPTEIRRDRLKRREMFAKRDRSLSISRRSIISDSIDDQIYGNPPPPQRRNSVSHVPLVADYKTVDPSKLDESARSGRSLMSEVTLDASTRDNRGGGLDASTRSMPELSLIMKTTRSPRQRIKKTRIPSSNNSDDGSVLTSTSDELTTISEKRRGIKKKKKKKNGSGESVSSKSSRKSKTGRKKTTKPPSRKSSMQSVGSCESIDELTVTSGDEIALGNFSIDDDEIDTASAKKKKKKKQPKAERRGSTGAITAKKKSTKKSKSKDESSNEGSSVPLVVGAGW